MPPQRIIAQRVASPLVLAVLALLLSFAATAQAPASGAPSASPEAQLQSGIALTRQGRFAAAIPFFLAARGHVADAFAADFNLALCYVATGGNTQAIALLEPWRSSPSHRELVNNLLAQAQIGAGNHAAALAALKTASAANPRDEKLYLLVADACTDHRQPQLGLQVVDLGLRHLPRSARLHYERGVFLSALQQSEAARQEFARARALAPDSAIGALAAAQAAMLGGEPRTAAAAARQGLARDPANYILLTLLGQALLAGGAQPGQADFAAAETALAKAVAERPNFAPARLQLGQLYLLANRNRDAAMQLVAARRLDPGDAAADSLLAAAYRKLGDREKLGQVLAELVALNRRQRARYQTGAPASYIGAAPAAAIPH